MREKRALKRHSGRAHVAHESRVSRPQQSANKGVNKVGDTNDQPPTPGLLLV